MKRSLNPSAKRQLGTGKCLTIQTRSLVQEMGSITSRFTVSKIISIFKQHESGLKVEEFCKECGISQATFSKWRAK